MLRPSADYPYPGSFALMIDAELPVERQRAELVRILERGATVALIAWPLRLGAAGNRRVPLGDLTDATELTKAEERELADLQRSLKGRVRNRTTKEKRAEALRQRAIWSLVMRAERAKLALLDARSQPSRGGFVPSEVAA